MSVETPISRQRSGIGCTCRIGLASVLHGVTAQEKMCRRSVAPRRGMT